MKDATENTIKNQNGSTGAASRNHKMNATLKQRYQDTMNSAAQMLVSAHADCLHTSLEPGGHYMEGYYHGKRFCARWVLEQAALSGTAGRAAVAVAVRKWVRFHVEQGYFSVGRHSEPSGGVASLESPAAGASISGGAQ